MTRDRITPLKSERIQRRLPAGKSPDGPRTVRHWQLPDARLAAHWAGFLAALAEAQGARPRIGIEGELVELTFSTRPEAAAAERRLARAIAAL
jgi:hypothetical protein